MRSNLARLALSLGLCAAGSAWALPSVPEGARGEGGHDGEAPRVRAFLLVDVATARPGEAFRAGVLFRLDPEWHIYWRNSGEAGLPTRLRWSVGAAEVGPLQWPAPRVFSEAEGFITTYGYADEVLLANDITPAPHERGSLDLAVAADFLVCRIQCIPGSIELERSVPLGPLRADAGPDVRAIFDRFAQATPVAPERLGLQLEALYSQSAIRPGDAFRAAVAAVSCIEGEPDCRPVRLGARRATDAFVPDADSGLELEVTGQRAHPHVQHGFIVTLGGRAGPDAVEGDQRLRGVLRVYTPEGLRYAEVDLALPRAPKGAQIVALESAWLDPESPRGAASAVTLWSAIGLGVIGGLILNLMPCVLPVLAIKVFGVAEMAHGGPSALRASGLAYTAGILITMAALAAVVLSLRAAGTAVGWGFQFQEPLFVAAISAVLVLFALNMFGVFEISLDTGRLGGLGTQATGARRSFFEGLLAVVVATPCSAPYLGTAVGFAFASPPAVIIAVFLSIGLGLALPYLAVTWIPAWARWIPRSGPWMLQVRALMGFALLGTVVWLLWLTGRTSGVDGLIALLSFLVALALGAWIYGALQSGSRRRLAHVFGAALLVAAMGVGASLPLRVQPRAAAPTPDEGWREFQPEAVQEALRAGHPVFVDFTADWCLTCKANEHLVIQTPPVRAAIDRLDVVLFRADWTRRDERIRRELERHGKAGVPLYLVYSPARPDSPEVLPELLSTERLIEALRSAAAGETGIRATSGAEAEPLS